MAGNPEAAAIWADADVYVGPLTAVNPASVTTPFPATWGLVGLLDGDKGFTEKREEQVSDHYAWGGILVRTSRSRFKLTRTITVLEDNEQTRKLIWPGSTDTEIIVPRPQPVKLGFELREGDKIKRLITRRYAEVSVDGDIVENETDLAAVTLVATIFPDSSGVLFDRQHTEEDEPGS
ncbi:hypothetical protein [Microtetraspora malaysiensis]|uniref:Phage tail protein n=1 Tax=Microtetraspora malaysiensis TaxID=161358 RepID=A0ABW6T3A2_9ACTN